MMLADFGYKDAGLNESQIEAVIIASREISELLNIDEAGVGKGFVLTPVLHDAPGYRIAREVLMEVGPNMAPVDFVYNWAVAVTKFSKTPHLRLALSELLYIDVPKDVVIKQIANKWKNAELGISSTLNSLCVEYGHLEGIREVTSDFHGQLDSSMPMTSIEASVAIHQLRSRINDAGGQYDSDAFILLVSFIEMRAECAKAIEEVSLMASNHIRKPISYVSRIQNIGSESEYLDVASNAFASVISRRLKSLPMHSEPNFQLTPDEIIEVESRLPAAIAVIGQSTSKKSSRKLGVL